MKNIHITPTPNPSRIIKNHHNKLLLTIQTLPLDKEIYCYPQNIHITDGSEIKNRDWCVDIEDNVVFKVKEQGHSGLLRSETDSFVEDSCRKIIFTTDRQIIKDGIQAIPEEFLEWFVAHTSCEKIEVIQEYRDGYGNWYLYQKEMFVNVEFNLRYKIIIPKEEPLYDYGWCRGNVVLPKEEPKWEVTGNDDDRPKPTYCYAKEQGDESSCVFPVCHCGLPIQEPKQETQNYICQQTKKQCDDECCVSAEDCHIEASIGVLSELKQETLEEDNFTLIEKELIKEAKKVWRELHPNPVEMALFGAKWQLENMYNEEEVLNLLIECSKWQLPQTDEDLSKIKQWFKKIKKK